MYKTSFDVTVSSGIALWKIILQVTSEMFLEVSIQYAVATSKYYLVKRKTDKCVFHLIFFYYKTLFYS